MDILQEGALSACGVGRGDRVLAALSGGADSTAMLLALHEAQERGEIKALTAAHLHHGIRGESADADLAFCEALCARLGVPLITERADVPAYAAAERKTLEEAARDLRYAFLRRAMADCGADCVAVAHHREDQAETLLLHLLRGSGLTGLTGMRARNGDVVRPLLDVSRAKIEAYLHEHGQAWREDETNAASDAMRNRVRHELVPLLESMNPRASSSLARTAALLNEDAAYLDALACSAEERVARGDGLLRAELSALPPVLSGRILRARLYALRGVVTQADVRRTLALCGAQTGACIELSGGYAAWVDAEALYIGVYPVHAPYCVPFCTAGDTVYPGGRMATEAMTGLAAGTFRKPKDGAEAYLDAAKLPDGLVVRTRRDGDRFYPLGAPGRKLLSDWMTDRKIPLEKRGAIPLLCAGDEAYYVAGYTVSERVRVTDETKTILHIICKGVRDDGEA